MNRHIFSFIMMTALLAAVGTSCNKDKEKTPTWVQVAHSKFENGRFVPDLADISPGAFTGANSSTAARAGSSAPSSLKAMEDCETIKFADLQGSYWQGLRNVLNNVDDYKAVMEGWKQSLLYQLEHQYEQNPSVPMGEWNDRVKYEETSSGDQSIYFVSPAGELQIKLTMRSDGANEVYLAIQENGGQYNRQQYSYLKDDKFIYITCHSFDGNHSSADIFLFNAEDGQKKGKLAGFGVGGGETGFGLSAFEGDDRDALWHMFRLVNANTNTQRKGQDVSAVVDGLPVSFTVRWEYGDIFDYRQDVRAFGNIDEIYFNPDKRDLYPDGIGDVCGIKLTDGTLIEESDDEMFDRFRLFESEQIVELEDGYWDVVKTGGLGCIYNMFWTQDDPTGAPSAAIPAWLKAKGLKFMDGFDELYLGLRADSDVYFDNFYMSEFAPLAGTQLKYENVPTLMNILFDYVQAYSEGFEGFE